jgi:5-methyltetrahydrofolate--homocysteine methyltransferase
LNKKVVAMSVLEQIANCVEAGKADKDTNIPPGSAGQPGVVELIQQLLGEGVEATVILQEGLLKGMGSIGRKFAANEVFIPEVLIAARAMHAGFAILKPAFAEQDVPSRGTFVIGTVRGDLHDIGKNLVSIILEGAGWEIVDLGTDVPPERFVEAVQQHPRCAVGLSALLTTTMVNMRECIEAIRGVNPETRILVGGAPVTARFAEEIGADGYADDPSAALALLNELQPPAAW